MRETVYRLRAPMRLNIALLADLHNRPYRRIVDALAARRPDIICVAGDILVGRAPKGVGPALSGERNAVSFLRACRELAPVYVSLGNHERRLTKGDLRRLRDTGVTLLDNEWLDRGGLVIGGLTSGRVLEYRRYRAGLQPDLARAGFLRRNASVPPELGWLAEYERQPGYHLLLSHHPEYWEPYLRCRRIELVLSGHAHGGQIRLFGRGLFAPGQGLLPGYTRGVHEGPHGSLVISAGLSNTAGWVPRLFNPREIVCIELGEQQ